MESCCDLEGSLSGVTPRVSVVSECSGSLQIPAENCEIVPRYSSQIGYHQKWPAYWIQVVVVVAGLLFSGLIIFGNGLTSTRSNHTAATLNESTPWKSPGKSHKSRPVLFHRGRCLEWAWLHFCVFCVWVFITAI